MQGVGTILHHTPFSCTAKYTARSWNPSRRAISEGVLPSWSACRCLRPRPTSSISHWEGYPKRRFPIKCFLRFSKESTPN